MTSAGQSNRIDEEEVCIDSLAANLRQCCGCRNVQVQREKNDPPDFWMNADGHSYAVEVTSIVTGQAYFASCKAFRDSVEDSARNQGFLKGRYALLMLRKPDLPRRASREWHTVVDRAVSFIQATTTEESAKEFNLINTRQGRLSITKVNAADTAVSLIGPTEGKYRVEIRDELRDLMQEAIVAKRRKLEKKGVPAHCPEIILAFYDAYGLGELDDARHALLQTKGHEWFHSVFWATSFTNRENVFYPDSPGRCGKFLYTKMADWR